jgi:hypothetical protein
MNGKRRCCCGRSAFAMMPRTPCRGARKNRRSRAAFVDARDARAGEIEKRCQQTGDAVTMADEPGCDAEHAGTPNERTGNRRAHAEQQRAAEGVSQRVDISACAQCIDRFHQRHKDQRECDNARNDEDNVVAAYAEHPYAQTQRGRGSTEMREKVKTGARSEAEGGQREEYARAVRQMIVRIVAHEKIAEHVDADVRAYRGQQCCCADGNQRETSGQRRSFTAEERR